MGIMITYGSYVKNEVNLNKATNQIEIFDTGVAFLAGMMIIPAVFVFLGTDGMASGPSLIFITLPNVFVNMAGGRIWGTLFFLFMTFASFSTVIAVFENLVSFVSDTFKISRKKSSVINFAIVFITSLPCMFGFNLLSGVNVLGMGILDMEDFVVSNILLPLGSLVYLLFCVTKFGWGFDNYYNECNTGKGMKLPRIVKPYLQYVLPILILIVFAQKFIG